MITIIETRKSYWYGKLPFAILFPIADTYLISKALWGNGISETDLLAIGFIALTVGFYISTILEMILIPKGAILDTDTKQIEVQYFFEKRIIYLDEISSLSSNSISTRYKQTGTDYDGIMVYLKSGERVLFSDNYMADQSDICIFLKNAGIPSKGEEGFSTITYYLDNYKVNKKS